MSSARYDIIEHFATMPFTDNVHLFKTILTLVEGWCDRRCLKALGWILRGYPLTSPLGDGWGDLLVGSVGVLISSSSQASSNAASRCVGASSARGYRSR